VLGGRVGGGCSLHKYKNNSQIGYKEGKRYRRWRETCKSRTGRSMDGTVCEREGEIDYKIRQEGRNKNVTRGRTRLN